MVKKLRKITENATLPKSAWFPNYQRYQYQMLIAQIEDFNKNSDTISRPCFLYFLKNKSSKSVTVGPGRFIFLNGSASPKMVIKMYFNFFFKF